MSDTQATATMELADAAAALQQSAPAGSTAGSSSSGSLTKRVTTPSEALLMDEARRMRIFSGAVAVVSLFVLLSLLPMAGNETYKYTHLIAVMIFGVVGAANFWYLRDPDNYATWVVNVLVVFGGVALTSGFLYWGVYSSAVLFVPIVLYFFSGTKSYWPSLLSLFVVGLPHGVIGVLTVAGAMGDEGVVRAFVLSKYEQLAVVFLAQFAFVVTFFLARMVRASVTDAVEQLEAAVRDIAKREALLAEAKHDLERALAIGGPGIYTDQTLGSYKLGNVLGRGAMGEVYDAVHVSDGEPAAVKVLTPTAVSNSALVHRFLREVTMAASVTSPHVARVLEVPTGDAPLPYLAMERLDGESLADLLRQKPRLPLRKAVTMLEEVCTGVEAAHAAGIVHRDLKPRNLFLHHAGDSEQWKVLDFGISKLAGHGGTLTRGDQVVGTPAYMSPEQARGLEVDHRADIYALGAVAYRALTGRPAFSGGDIPSILYSVVNDMPPRPTIMAKLPAGVDDVLLVALAKKPADRFASATELATALKTAVRGVIDADVQKRARELEKDKDWGKLV